MLRLQQKDSKVQSEWESKTDVQNKVDDTLNESSK